MNGFSRILLFGPGLPEVILKLKTIGTDGILGDNFLSAGPSIGEEADFEVKWKKDPSFSEIINLVKSLDSLLENTKVRYTITSSSSEELLKRFNSTEKSEAFTFLRLYGPSISKALDVLNTRGIDLTGIKDTISGEMIGSYDYALEWIYLPEVKDVINLLGMLDELLEPTGVFYRTITRSKLSLLKSEKQIDDKRSERSLRLV